MSLSKIAQRVAAKFMRTAYGDPPAARPAYLVFPKDVDALAWYQENEGVFSGQPWFWDAEGSPKGSNVLVVNVYEEGVAPIWRRRSKAGYIAPLLDMVKLGRLPGNPEVYESESSF